MPSMAQGGLRNFTENPNQLNRKFPNHEAKVDPFSRKQKIAQHRKSLPIASVEKRLVDEVRKNDTLIIVGETGSGKTTQLPHFLFKAGFCWDGRTIDHCSWLLNCLVYMKQQFCPKEQFSLVQELRGSQIERILVATMQQIRRLLEVQ